MNGKDLHLNKRATALKNNFEYSTASPYFITPPPLLLHAPPHTHTHTVYKITKENLQGRVPYQQAHKSPWAKSPTKIIPLCVIFLCGSTYPSALMTQDLPLFPSKSIHSELSIKKTCHFSLVCSFAAGAENQSRSSPDRIANNSAFLGSLRGFSSGRCHKFQHLAQSIIEPSPGTVSLCAWIQPSLPEEPDNVRR